MKKLLFCFCLLLILSACTKLTLKEDPQYANTRITAQQHLSALQHIPYWSSTTTLEVRDSVFHYRHLFGTFLGDWVPFSKWNEVDKTYDRGKVLCDWDFIDEKVQYCLVGAFTSILPGERERSSWRARLWIRADVLVRRRGLEDTTVKYEYPFTSSLFD